MSQIESGDAKLLAYRSEIAAAHIFTLIGVIRSDDAELSAFEEEIVRRDVHELHAVADRVARRYRDREEL